MSTYYLAILYFPQYNDNQLPRELTKKKKQVKHIFCNSTYNYVSEFLWYILVSVNKKLIKLNTDIMCCPGPGVTLGTCSESYTMQFTTTPINTPAQL